MFSLTLVGNAVVTGIDSVFGGPTAKSESKSFKFLFFFVTENE